MYKYMHIYRSMSGNGTGTQGAWSHSHPSEKQQALASRKRFKSTGRRSLAWPSLLGPLFVTTWLSSAAEIGPRVCLLLFMAIVVRERVALLEGGGVVSVVTLRTRCTGRGRARLNASQGRVMRVTSCTRLKVSLQALKGCVPRRFVLLRGQRCL